eukprot:8537241-Prorocentrum_lima.AAC.1
MADTARSFCVPYRLIRGDSEYAEGYWLHQVRLTDPSSGGELEFLIDGVRLVHPTKIIQALSNEGIEATLRTDRAWHAGQEQFKDMFIARAVPQHHQQLRNMLAAKKYMT